MDELPPEAVPIVGLALVLVAVLVVVGVVSARREARRRDRIRHWAANSGWTVARRQRVGWSVRPPGSSRKVSLLVTGTVGGYPVQVAEYSVTKYSTTSTAASAQVSASASVWPTSSTKRRRTTS